MKTKSKLRIVLSFTLAIALAAAGCATDLNQLADDVADDDVVHVVVEPDAGLPTQADGIGTSPSDPKEKQKPAEGGIIIQKSVDDEGSDVCPIVAPNPCAIWVGPDAASRAALHLEPNMVVYTGHGTSCIDAYWIAEDFWPENYVLHQVHSGWIKL